jgi:integrase
MHPERNAVPPRRTKVANRRGIYYRVNARGKRTYEISYRDSLGVRRFKTVPGNLEDAQAALDEIRSRLRRGERIAPSRVTVAELAPIWLASQGQLRARTREKYEGAIRLYIVPLLGHLKVSQVTEDHVVALIHSMQQRGKAPWTIRGVMTPLGRLLGYAVRRGYLASNPMGKLERGERPAIEAGEKRILTRDEIQALLTAATPKYRPLIATAAFTGLRLGELLGLVWTDVDFDAGYLHVRRQLDRTGQRVAPKTKKAVRDVVLMPALGRALREHRLASPYSADTDPVFSSATGTPLGYRNVERRGLHVAADAAGLNAPGLPKLQLHHLRHSFASILVSEGLDIVTVSRQLGHATPAITLGIYAHLFDQARHADRTRKAMEESFASLFSETAASATVITLPNQS